VLASVVQGLLAGLTDPLLPVQSAAACSICQLIHANGTKDMLRPFLPQLVGHYFRIMNEVENEEVLMSLQQIVSVYGEEITPLALEMTHHLINAFAQFRSQVDDGDEQTVFNAVQCLDTILSILEVRFVHSFICLFVYLFICSYILFY